MYRLAVLLHALALIHHAIAFPCTNCQAFKLGLEETSFAWSQNVYYPGKPMDNPQQVFKSMCSVAGVPVPRNCLACTNNGHGLQQSGPAYDRLVAWAVTCDTWYHSVGWQKAYQCWRGLPDMDKCYRDVSDLFNGNGGSSGALSKQPGKALASAQGAALSLVAAFGLGLV